MKPLLMLTLLGCFCLGACSNPYLNYGRRENTEGLKPGTLLSPNRPTPFWPTTEIEVAGPLKRPNQLSVSSVTGQVLANVENIIADSNYIYVMNSGLRIEYREDGGEDTLQYSLEIDSFSSGIYMFQLTTPDTVFTQKMVLMKWG